MMVSGLHSSSPWNAVFQQNTRGISNGYRKRISNRESGKHFFAHGALSPIFKSNPKYPVDGVARIAYSDVMHRKYIIRHDEEFSDNSCWSKDAKIIAEYKGINDLVNDGWRLD